jgi:hypothetical protein
VTETVAGQRAPLARVALKPKGGRACIFALALAAASCSSDEVTTSAEPKATTGIEYTAGTSELRFEGNVNLMVTLTIANRSAEPITLTYPAGCPVRIRLYRVADDSLRYDETRLTCTVTNPAQLTLQPQSSRSFGSGFRSMPRMAGDSLQFTLYRVAAVPTTEQESILEIPAGLIDLKPPGS